MVTARKLRPSAPPPRPAAPAGRPATNLVRRTAAAPAALVDARKAPRIRVAQRAWLCGADGSVRGYALDLSLDGGRFGGAGTRLAVGTELIVKLVLDPRDPPLALKAQVVRYAPALHCPELCLRFVDVSEPARLRAFLDAR